MFFGPLGCGKDFLTITLFIGDQRDRLTLNRLLFLSAPAGGAAGSQSRGRDA
ncbi:hypothetical protein N1851_001795 [Merluccius polli]|uniref:Uncharacterized protein n=1 Tax=Merluccius polli TaxID=89951 RepID=A0AA47PDG7_MERPO|nr:hypothetical protein N1851_001795 [Merluccius polli]